MSNEITLEALLAQNAGTTIETFVPDDRLTHTIENIRNGDPITEELLTDLKNRQDDINTIINDRILELNNLDIWVRYYSINGNSNINSVTNIIEPPSGYSESDVCITLAYRDDLDEKLFESIGTLFPLGSGFVTYNLFINKLSYYNTIFIYRWVNSSNKFERIATFGFNNTSGISGSLVQIFYDSSTIPDNTITFDGKIDFDINSNYVTLDTARIQSGQLVDGLDTLIQANELDFDYRTQKIISYTQD